MKLGATMRKATATYLGAGLCAVWAGMTAASYIRNNYWVHVDHPWSYDVKEYGAPKRVYVHSPYGTLMIGEPSQVYDRKHKKYLDRYAHVTHRPI